VENARHILEEKKKIRREDEGRNRKKKVKRGRRS
jgi:hypothetical protein